MCLEFNNKSTILQKLIYKMMRFKLIYSFYKELYILEQNANLQRIDLMFEWFRKSVLNDW